MLTVKISEAGKAENDFESKDLLPGYQTSDSASSSKFHHLPLLVALVLH